MCNTNSDSWSCRPCTYPNGILVLIVAQILMLAASILSLVSMGDCHFVTVEASKVDPFLTTIFKDNNETATLQSVSNDERRGIGFFFYEDIKGNCNWDKNHTEATFEEYVDFLGDDWEGPRGAGTTALVLGWCFWGWLLAFSCAAHVKVARYILAAVIIVTQTILQASTYAVLDSDFCNDHDCQIGRSARCGAVAVALFFVTGVLMFFTKDYPGKARNEQQPIGTAVVIKDRSVPQEQQRHDDHTVDEEDPNHHHLGFAEAQEIPADSAFVDVSLTQDTGPNTKATIY